MPRPMKRGGTGLSTIAAITATTSAKKGSAFLGMGQDIPRNHRANAQRQPGDGTYQRKQNPTHSHTPHNQRLIFQQENRQGEKRADLRVCCVHIHTDVSMSSLFDKPLLIHERYENAIISLCKEYGFAPHIFCKSDDIFPLPYWAAEGLGIAILPRSSIHLASSEKLYFHHIENLPLTTTGVIIHAKRYALSRIAQNFIQFWETRPEGHGHST